MITPFLEARHGWKERQLPAPHASSPALRGDRGRRRLPRAGADDRRRDHRGHRWPRPTRCAAPWAPRRGSSRSRPGGGRRRRPAATRRPMSTGSGRCSRRSRRSGSARPTPRPSPCPPTTRRGSRPTTRRPSSPACSPTTRACTPSGSSSTTPARLGIAVLGLDVNASTGTYRIERVEPWRRSRPRGSWTRTTRASRRRTPTCPTPATTASGCPSPTSRASARPRWPASSPGSPTPGSPTSGTAPRSPARSPSGSSSPAGSTRLYGMRGLRRHRCRGTRPPRPDHPARPAAARRRARPLRPGAGPSARRAAPRRGRGSRALPSVATSALEGRAGAGPGGGAVPGRAAGACGRTQQPTQLALDLGDRPELTVGTGLPEMTGPERVRAELDILGLDASAHVVDFYAPMLEALGVTRSRDLLRARSRSTVWVCGVKVATQTPPIRSGRRVVFLTLDDSTGPVDATFFEDVQGPYAATVFHSWMLLVRGVVRRTGAAGHLAAGDRRVGAHPAVGGLASRGPRAPCYAAIDARARRSAPRPRPRRRRRRPAARGRPHRGRRVLVHASGFKQSPVRRHPAAGGGRAWGRAGSARGEVPEARAAFAAAAQAVALQPRQLRTLGWDPFCSGEPGRPPRATDEGGHAVADEQWRTRRGGVETALRTSAVWASVRDPRRRRRSAELGRPAAGPRPRRRHRRPRRAARRARPRRHRRRPQPRRPGLAVPAQRRARGRRAHHRGAGRRRHPRRHRGRPARRPRLLPRHPRGRRRPRGHARRPRRRARSRRHLSLVAAQRLRRRPGPRPGRAVRPGPTGPGQRPTAAGATADPLPRRFDAARAARPGRPPTGLTVEDVPRRAPLQRPRALGPDRLRGRPRRPARARGRSPAATPTSASSASSAPRVHVLAPHADAGRGHR